MELGAQLAPVGVDGICQTLVKRHALLGVQGGSKAVGQHRHIADDDHGTASGGDFAQPLQQFLLREAQTGGGEDDPVL